MHRRVPHVPKHHSVTSGPEKMWEASWRFPFPVRSGLLTRDLDRVFNTAEPNPI
jgi:hypothetical protein